MVELVDIKEIDVSIEIIMHIMNKYIAGEISNDLFNKLKSTANKIPGIYVTEFDKWYILNSITKKLHYNTLLKKKVIYIDFYGLYKGFSEEEPAEIFISFIVDANTGKISKVGLEA